jgi:hypothetical protein
MAKRDHILNIYIFVILYHRLYMRTNALIFLENLCLYLQYLYIYSTAAYEKEGRDIAPSKRQRSNDLQVFLYEAKPSECNQCYFSPIYEWSILEASYLSGTCSATIQALKGINKKLISRIIG